MATVKDYINNLYREIAEVEAELAKLDPQSAIYNYTAPGLQTQIAEKRSLIQQAEKSLEYRLEQTIDAEIEARREERTFMARQQARLDRIAAERRAYDEQVDSIDWRLVNVPFIEQRRAIVREHLAELNKRREEAALYANESRVHEVMARMNLTPAQMFSVSAEIAKFISMDFETKYTDEETGRCYVVITDSEGTYVDSDYSA